MKKHVTFGVALIVLAILIIMNAFGYIGDINIWTLILSFLLLWIFLASIIKLEFFGIFVSLGLGIILYREQLGLQSINSWAIIVAAILLGIGFSIIFKKKRIHYYKFEEYNNYSKNNGPKFKEKRNEARNKSRASNQQFTGGYYGYTDNHSDKEDYSDEPIEDNIVTYRSRFSNTTRFIKSKKLEKAFFDNEFGSLTIYLDQVDLSENGAKIEVYCRFGNIRLFIPHHFYVENLITNDFGNVTMPYNTVESKENNTIILKGNVTLGDIKIVRI